MAHDIGARVAYRFTLDHEDMVHGRILDSTPPHERYGPQRPQVVRERWHSYFHQQYDLPEKSIEGREEIYRICLQSCFFGNFGDCKSLNFRCSVFGFDP